MEPVVNRTKPLRFYELGADAFQRLCRALIRELPEVDSTHIYGTNGQSQRGIDIEARLKKGNRWAGQCKACEKNILKYLEQAVDEFLPHLDFWKDAGADKFVVLIGCGIEDTKVLDSIRDYERHFLSRGMIFEVWDSEEIRRLLRTMRAVVEEHLPIWLWEHICGVQPDLSLPSGGATPQLVVSSALIAEIGSIHDGRLDEIRELVRSGKETHAESQLRILQGTAAWHVFPPSLKARVFRMLAGLALNRRDDLQEAKELLKRGKEADPDGRFAVTEAVIRNHESGAVAALEAMPNPTNRDEWNLRIVLLINSGRLDEAHRAVEAPAFESDAETDRLGAIVHLLRRDLEKARAAADEALRKAPNWSLVRQVDAVVDYYCALSPAFKEWTHLIWPVPPDWHFVRRDAASTTAMRHAAERFGQLASEAEPASENWQHAVYWQLACLANDSSQQSEAAKLAGQILKVNPTAAPVVSWVLARDLDIDRETVTEALTEVCKRGPDETEPVQALFCLLSSARKFREAGELLDSHHALYDRRGQLDTWVFERAQAWMAEGEVEKAEAMLAEEGNDDLRGRLRVALARIHSVLGEWTPEDAAVFDAEFRRTKSDECLFEACEAHHFANRPEYVSERADELVNRVGTESALRLALDATAAAKRFDQCLSLMERHRTLFRDADFPPVVRRLRVLCLREKGRLFEAERELRLLAGDQGLPEDRFELFSLQLSTGQSEDAANCTESVGRTPNNGWGPVSNSGEDPP